MIAERKPRLLFLRFTQPNLPIFIRQHLQEHVNCLSIFFDVTVIDTPTNAGKPYDYARLCDTYKPDLAVFESGIYVGYRDIINVTSHSHVPKIAFIHSDAYCESRACSIYDMDRWGIDTVFTMSVSMATYLPHLASKLFVWPNFVNQDIFRDYGHTKIIPVLFSGSQAIHYPWRNKINRAISQFYPTLQSPHFGWHNAGSVANRLLTGKAYAELINASWTAPACGTIANEIVRKHFEIPACNTCLITQRTPTVEAAGFRDNENCIFADENDVLEKLDRLFRHPDEMSRIAAAGRRLVHAHHTMQQRDQFYQWYKAHKQLKTGERIVQLGPFASMSIVPGESSIWNNHVDAQGIDRELLRRAYRCLQSGDYPDAEQLFRRCLNYHYMPEAVVGLAVSALYQGEAEKARQSIGEHMQRVFDRGGEPDVVEWAYYIVSLLCLGRRQDAVRVSGQLSGLRHEVLDHARIAALVIVGRRPGEADLPSGRVCRGSLHALEEGDKQGQLSKIVSMLKACGQPDAANSLERYAAERDGEANATVTVGLTRTVGLSADCGVGKQLLPYRPTTADTFKSLRRRVTAKTKVKMALKKIVLPLLWKVESRIGYFLPPRWSLGSQGEDAVFLRKVLSGLCVDVAVLFGAEERGWLTNVFIQGMQANPFLPDAFLLSQSPAECAAMQQALGGNGQLQVLTSKDVEKVKSRIRQSVVLLAIEAARVSDEITPLLEVSPDTLILIGPSTEGGSKILRQIKVTESYGMTHCCATKSGELAIFQKQRTVNSAREYGMSMETSNKCVHQARNAFM